MNPFLESITTKITRGRVLLAVFGLVIFTLVYWLATHSFIYVTVNNPSGSGYTYQLINQSDQKNTSIGSNSSSVKRLVRRGSYEVIVTQDGKSYLTVVDTKAFLGKTTVAADLKSEKSRQFVGNNPGSCLGYLYQTLVSYSCNDSVQNLNVHVPATDTLPTYVKKISPGAFSGSVESTLTTKEGALVLVAGGGDNEGDGNKHFIYSLGNDFGIAKSVELSAPLPGDPYAAIPYKDGFLVYAHTLDHFFYYPSTVSQPTTLNIDKPKTQNLAAASLAIGQNQIITLFTHSTEAGDKKSASEVIVSDGNTTKHFNFSQNYSVVRACGSNKLCLLSNAGLDVYNIDKAKPVKLYSIAGATRIKTIGTSLIVVQPQGVIDLDVEQRTGYLEYGFGDYSYNDVLVVGGNYILSLTKPDHQKVALLIDRSKDNTDDIDKKALQIEQIVGVDAVSVYGKRIFVTPNAGSLVPLGGTAGYGYDPKALAAANDRVKQGVAKIGLDPSYKVINTTL